MTTPELLTLIARFELAHQFPVPYPDRLPPLYLAELSPEEIQLVQEYIRGKQRHRPLIKDWMELHWRELTLP